ncbi:MAG: nitrogenase associated protein [Chloroflexi bacterium RBG_13_46_9]|nr:MAG: nitrogenase associated protein [Chloroflexi bacterium RBG_13_46_9]
MADTKAGTLERCHDPYLRCAFYGAAQTALGVKGCCVIAHSPQGCYGLVNAAFGWQDADYTETTIMSTKLCEDEIVHGGEDVLNRTILQAQEMKPPVLFVISACGPEIVGDDITSVCEDVRPQVNFEIVPIRAPGFKGDQNDGIDIALEALLKKLVPMEQPKAQGGIYLIAPHANSNPTWMGDLNWVKGILEQLGIKKVISLTHNTSLSDFQNVASADGCIVLSHDAGQKAADFLCSKYGIKQFCRNLPLPIGFTNTRRWLLELGDKLGAKPIAQKLADDGEKMVVEQCRRKGLEQFFMHRAPAAIVADATVGIPLLHFIAEDLEMVPKLVCLRSCLPEAKGILERELKELNFNPKVIHKADVYQSKMSLAETRPEIVFGSNIERHAVEDLDIPFVFRIANPISRFRTIDREYFGYTGMLNLIETIHNDWFDRYRSKERRYKARW